MERSEAFCDLAGENIPKLGLCPACKQGFLILIEDEDEDADGNTMHIIQCDECGWSTGPIDSMWW